jgi:hypothetical protein|tara:strand:- start:84 stop:1004 length:921 start_codon:yes stop_codon:yes gene_type:complete
VIVKTNPEFGVELALTMPYVYSLHNRGKLDTVITSKGMKSFYYFCDDVREEFNYRTIDNAAAGLNDIPNNWIHGINPELEPGVLNYDEWEVPPFRKHYENKNYDMGKMVFISNKYNVEHGHTPFGYFDIKCLYDMFTYLTSKGYEVIYKRPLNTEFPIDQNEMGSVQMGLDIRADVSEVGNISDRDLPKYFDRVHLFDDLVDEFDYNTTQMMIMANTDYFISPCGGNTVLSCLWDRPVITYITQGKELRPNYFGENSYFQKLSNQNCIPVFDVIGDINGKTYEHKVNQTNKNNYTELLEVIKNEIR